MLLLYNLHILYFYTLYLTEKFNRIPGVNFRYFQARTRVYRLHYRHTAFTKIHLAGISSFGLDGIRSRKDYCFSAELTRTVR